MLAVNPWAVAVAIAAAFLVSMVWYAVLGARMAKLQGADPAPAASERPPVGKILVELLRSAVVAVALSLGLGLMGIGMPGALLVALVAWVAFPVVLLTGSVTWDRVPVQLAAIHAGDWLIKLLVIAAIVGAWR